MFRSSICRTVLGSRFVGGFAVMAPEEAAVLERDLVTDQADTGLAELEVPTESVEPALPPAEIERQPLIQKLDHLELPISWSHIQSLPWVVDKLHPQLNTVIIPIFEGVDDRTVYNISPPVTDKDKVTCLAARVEPLSKEAGEVMLFTKPENGICRPIKMNRHFLGEDPLIVKLADGRILVTTVVTAIVPADIDKDRTNAWFDRKKEEKGKSKGEPADSPETIWWEEAYVADSFADLKLGDPKQLLYRTPLGFKDTVPIPLNREQIAFVFRPRGWQGQLNCKRGMLAVVVVNIADLEKNRGDSSFFEINYDPDKGLPDNMRIFDSFFRGEHWGGIGNGELLENGLIALDGHAATFDQVFDDKSNRRYFGIECALDLGLVWRDGEWRFEGFKDQILGPDGQVLEKGRPARISHARVTIMREHLPQNLPVKPGSDPNMKDPATNLWNVVFVRGSGKDPETGVRSLYGGISDASPFALSVYFDGHAEWAKVTEFDNVRWICTARAKGLRPRILPPTA